jgi:hypothetical protein
VFGLGVDRLKVVNSVVNLCGYSWLQIGDPEGVVLGNIRDTTLAAMWNCDLIRQ